MIADRCGRGFYLSSIPNRFALTPVIKMMNKRKLFFTRAAKTLASIAKKTVGFPSAVSSGAVNILAYHRVVADIAKAEREAIYGIVISGKTFRRHCELLKESYEIVSLERAMKFLNGKEKAQEKPLAVITFDDGYLDFYTVAFPVLRDLNLPATNFLPTEYMGGKKFLAHDRIFWLLKIAREKQISIRPALEKSGIENAGNKEMMCDALVHLPNDLRETVITEVENLLGKNSIQYPREYQLLNWEQIGEMQNAGIDFGFHTANHTVLTLESDADFEKEIFAGKREIEKRLNKKITSFAYPNGAYNDCVKRAVADAGFEIAVTTERKINLPKKSDALALGRISLCEESTRGIGGHYSPSIARLRLGV